MINFKCVLVVLCSLSEKIAGELSDSELEKVPLVFATDDFPKCRKEGDIFCRIQFSVDTENKNSEVWRIIQDSKDDTQYFNRDVVYRYRCLPKILEEQDGVLRQNIILKENEFLKNFSLTASVDDLQCINYSKPIYLSTYDYALMTFFISYMALIVLATAIDTFNLQGKYIEKRGKSIEKFSLVSQWNDLRTPITEPDYQHMKCLQGVRVYNMAIVICGHTLSGRLFTYVNDARYLENFYISLVPRFIIYGAMHVVQTNFLISGWLHAKMMYKYKDSKKEISMRFLLKKIIGRYLRLLPTLAVIIAFETSTLYKLIVNAPPLERVELDYKACQKNWWATLLFVSNLFPLSETCNLGFWYLTDDFQMYILTSIIFYVMFRFDIGLKLLALVMAFFWCINFNLHYSLNLTPSFFYNPESGKTENSFGSYNMYAQYTSVYINYGSYGVGIFLGYLYHKYRNYSFKVTKIKTTIWFLVGSILPIGAVWLSLFHYPRLISAVLGASLKPIYALGIGVLLFGMIHGVGGVVKRFCECDLTEFIARWSYSTYLIHFFVVFGKHYFAEDLLAISHSEFINSTIVDIIMSFSAGLLIHLILERPLGYLLAGLFIEKASSKTKKE
ncbi:hypothetical protein JTB14_022753 [Gonioctena quinquepunctata]|nr:hypothetical protein JTB14_022753 [Gonioctena quinquepunctata]